MNVNEIIAMLEELAVRVKKLEDALKKLVAQNV